MRVREYLGIPYFVDDGPPRRVWGIDDPIEEVVMVIEQIEISQAADDMLEVTIKGDAAKLVQILANGLPREALVQLQEAIGTELSARGLVTPKAE